MKVTAYTDIGCRHETNQDCYKAGRLSDDTYWVVLCDGMGGVAAGGEASIIAVNYLEEAICESLLDIVSLNDIKDFMIDTIKRCNNVVYTLSRDKDDKITMGTTVVMAIVRNGLAQIVHAGDSRAYHITKKVIKQITHDHSVVQNLLDSKKITEQQARNHPNKNIITSAIGVEATIMLDFNEVKLRKGEMLLICTDGLSNMVSDEDIHEMVKTSDFYKSAETLVKRAVSEGGFDNITAVVLCE